MPWDVQFRNGVWLPQAGWWLDAHFPVERSFVSHAHFDHIAAHKEVLCSAGTARLLRARLPLEREEHILPYGHEEMLTTDVAVTLYPAGHIFGSAQSLLRHEEHGTLLYTGDFKLRPGLSAEPCATPPADLLIMETTYGRPKYVFPPTAEVIAAMVAFCQEAIDQGEVPVLFGYSLGKSQEILSGLVHAGLPVMLHPATARLTKVYEEFGMSFPAYGAFVAAEVQGHVVICPPQAPNSSFLRQIPAKRTAVITGWALDAGSIYRYQCDAAFPLSDHADFEDLLRYVERVKPKKVLTLHGFASDFAKTLRERGVEAWAIGEDNQLEIPLSLGGAELPPVPPALPPVSAVRNNKEGDESSSPATQSGAEEKAAADPRHDTGNPDAPPRPALLGAGAVPDHGERNVAFSPDGPLSPPGPSTSIEEKTTPPVVPGDKSKQALASPDAADDFRRFVAVAVAVAATPRKLEKVKLLADYFVSLSHDDAGVTAQFFTARAFPQADDRKLQLGWSVLKRAALGVTGVTEAELRAGYRRFGDAGDALGALLSGRYPGQPMSVSELQTFFEELASTRGPAAKIDLMQARFAELSGPEARYLVKIVTGDLRIGLKEGLVEEAIAAASAAPLERVREANMLCGDIAAVTRAALTGTLDTISLRIFHPLQFMLASPEPTASAILDRLGPPVWLEEKYDGIRCQVHRRGARAELYSRDLHRITGQFPDLARAALSLPGDFILDGELLAWRAGRALPFAELQKRLGRKGDDFFLGEEIPVSFSAYDLLWRDGRILLQEPLAERRRQLAGLLPGSAAPARVHPFLLAPVREALDAVEIEAAFLQARARGNEGLMAKDPASPYTPGRRGLAWLKLKKAYATLDVVVVGVEYGHGKRRDVLSDYTFAIRDPETNRFLTVGKAYTGLTDVEIAHFTRHFLDHTLEVRGHYRIVVPDTVLEVAFDSIQPSKRHESGFALRFPRIARIRADKTPAEIDTLETCRKLAQPQTQPHGGTAP